MAASNMMSQYVSLGVESSDCGTLSNCNCCHNPRNRELVLEQSRCLDRGQWLWEITMCLGSNLDMPAVFLGSLKSQTNYLYEIHFLRTSKRLCLWPPMSTILPFSCTVITKILESRFNFFLQTICYLNWSCWDIQIKKKVQPRSCFHF